jgi:TRAP-type C4-dicarboxylate transport system permease small subunit
MLWSLFWWGMVIGASYQAARAWGNAAGPATAIGLWVIQWFIPVFSGLLTLAGAIAIGAAAEKHIQGQITGKD